MSNTPPTSMVARDDLWTVAAIGVLAACITTTAHEAMGHGGLCLLRGGQITRLTSVYFQCKPGMDWIAAAGPIGNLTAALAAFLIRGVVPAAKVRLRLLLILVTAFSLFWEAGYVIHAMIHDDGDWVFAARELFGRPETSWRIGGVILGVILYAIGIGVTRRAMRPFTDAGSKRATGLLRWAWLGGALSAVLAALAYTPDRDAITQAALEIGAASWPLLLLAVGARNNGAQTQAVERSWAWIGAAAAVFAAFVATLGRGLPY